MADQIDLACLLQRNMIINPMERPAMVFPDTSLHEMTLLFLLIVGALAVTLVWLFSMLETSAPLARVRTALIRRSASNSPKSAKF